MFGIVFTSGNRWPSSHRAGLTTCPNRRLNDKPPVMPTYLVKVSYTEDGTQSVLEEGATSRREKLRHYTEKLGGTLESLYYALGDHDAYAIVKFPDKTSMAVASMLTKASGGGTCTATVLLTPEEIDEATEKRKLFE